MSKRMIAFGYYGGKNSKLNFILPQLKTKHRTYVELCGGSAAVLLNKPRAKIEVLNDKADEIINFWKVLREQPDKLIRQINNTPAGESEFKRILSLPSTDNKVEKARRFFVHISQVYANAPMNKHHAILGNNAFIKKRAGLKSIAERIRDVWIENTDAVRLINRVINATKPIRQMPVLFYADPPYSLEARNRGDVYIHDDFNHAAFLDAVLDTPDFCKFAISGYANKLYDDRLADWYRVEKEVQMTVRDKHQRRTEVLWRNYELMDMKMGKLF